MKPERVAELRGLGEKASAWQFFVVGRPALKELLNEVERLQTEVKKLEKAREDIWWAIEHRVEV